MKRSGTQSGSATLNGERFRDRVRGGLRLALALSLCLAGAARGDGAELDAWRASAAKVRLLAEWDIARANAAVLQLQKSLPADATPTDRAKVLNLQARVEIYQGSSADATRHATEALAIATKHGDRIGQAEADLNISLSSVNEGRIDLLLLSAPRALAALDGVDRPELLSEALLRMAMMYHRMGQLEESVTMTMQTMEIARATKNPLAMTYAHQGLGISMSLSDRLQDSHDQYAQMRLQARAANSRLLETYAMLGLGTLKTKLNQLDEGEKLIREAIAQFRVTGAPFGVSHAQYILADFYKQQGRHADTLPLFAEIIANYEKYGNIIGLWYSLNARSAAHLQLGNHGAALADAQRGYALAEKINLSSSRSESAQRVAAIYAVMGEHRKAYELSAEAAAEMARSTRKKANARMLELAQRYESESRRREIDELTRRNEMQVTQLRQRELMQRWLWTVLVGSIATLGATGFFLLRLRRSHATIGNLNASLEQRVQVRTAELRQQTRYLRTLIDTLPWWVWLKDTGSRYLAVNQAAADTCGLSADELVGKTDLDVRPRDMADAFRADDQVVMATRCRKTVEEFQLLSDGASTWMETFKAPVLDEDGSVLGTVGFARDISERKAAEAAREAALAEAQRLARVRSDFLAQMSHELRTPLNGVLGYAQILRRDKGLGERQLAGVKVIQQSGEHLLALINDILDLAKIEAGKLELSCSDVSLKQCLQSIAEIIGIKAEQKQLDFICAIGDLPSMVRADEKRLRQVLLNLLANAVKFTERGFVRLDVRFSAPDRFRFEVADSGIGIDAGHADAIFQPFEQVDQVQRRFGGTGLGLAITRQFVHLMGGEIGVDSTLGKGSVFWFELALPVLEGEAAAHALEQVVIGYAGPRKTILVVDDVAGNRAVAVDLLGQLGFAMLEAADGVDAVQQTELLKPDLVLMDIVMPGMDGLEATRRLRALPACRAVPIIAVSASAFSQDEERYLASDVNAFLAKPVDHVRLLACIADLLQLTLLYDKQAAPVPIEAREPAALVAPPQEQIAVLFGLARLGNMQDILRWAGRLDELDERYRPFAERLRVLANGYQSRAILHFVSGYLDSELS